MNKEPELHEIVKSKQTHRHTFTCRKKKGVQCRFNAPWPPSDKTMIVRVEDIPNESVRKSKQIVEKVINKITNYKEDICGVTLDEILNDCGLSKDSYTEAMKTTQKSISIHYKRSPVEKV